MNHELISLLLKGKITAADCSFINDELFPSEVLDWSDRTRNISLYSLIAARLININNIEDQQRAAYLLSMILFIYEGGYSLALFHVRKIILLDPTNLEYKRFLLFFHDIPEHLVKKDEAIKIALEILDYDPNCFVSLQVLIQYGILKDRKI